MSTGPHIGYLKRQEIDITRWDNCIRQAPNGLIYGLHFYLDHMTDGQWDALVLGDYQAVMPLTWRRKFGVSYLYQPPFTQQTGIFSPEAIPLAMIEAFLETSVRHFRFAEIFLNYGNPHPSFTAHENFILPLDAPYDQLASQYKKKLAHSVKLSMRKDLGYKKDLDPVTALEGYRREYATRIPHVRPEHYRRFEQLCLYLQDKGQLIVRAATYRQQVLATVLLLRDHRRLYLIQSTTPPVGRKMEANHFLMDQLIREWADSRLILDFEGSDLPGVARFYARFGGTLQPYYFYRDNRLWWPLKLLKRQ